MMSLLNKKIVIGVSGGIATYKVCELVRELKRMGAEVRIAMTPAATEFVSELTFATLSGNKVITSLFEGSELEGTSHIELARWADLVVICPATANFISKVAHGLADDFLSTTLLATTAPVIFCPAMNSVMWEKEIIQKNVEQLVELGYTCVNPEWGALATATEGEGWGRLAILAKIIHAIRTKLLATSELVGKRVLVTAGPTRERIDPVRFITNYSTGKMGFALAVSAALRGADVALVSGPNHLDKPFGIDYHEVESADEMNRKITEEYENTDILLMCAAVSDFKPETVSSHKVKKTESTQAITLKKNVDILATLGRKKKHKLHIGFAVETQNEIENAIQKMESKNLDMVVLNNPLEPDAAFAGDNNIVILITSDHKTEKLPKLSKTEVADVILDRVCDMVHDKQRQSVAV